MPAEIEGKAPELITAAPAAVNSKNSRLFNSQLQHDMKASRKILLKHR
jgi:hypothetical protein